MTSTTNYILGFLLFAALAVSIVCIVISSSSETANTTKNGDCESEFSFDDSKRILLQEYKKAEIEAYIQEMIDKRLESFEAEVESINSVIAKIHD